MRPEAELANLVSIVIPTLNRPESLQRAVQSSLEQSYQNIEVLILDNCSTDETTALAKSIKDQRVKIFRSKIRLSLSENWQRGVDVAAGRYMLVLSDDDILHSNAVETLIKPFLIGLPKRKVPASQISLSIGRCRMLHKDSASHSGMRQEAYLEGEQFVINSLKGRSAFYPSASLFKVADARKVGGFIHDNVDFSCDVQLAARLARLSGVAFTEKHVVDYCIHINNVTKTHNIDKIIRETEEYASYCWKTIAWQMPKIEANSFKYLLLKFKARRIFSLIKGSNTGTFMRVTNLFKVRHYATTPLSFWYFLCAILYSMVPEKFILHLRIGMQKIRSLI